MYDKNQQDKIGDIYIYNVGKTIRNHPWLGMVYTPPIYGDDWGMVYDIVLPTLYINNKNQQDKIGDIIGI